MPKSRVTAREIAISSGLSASTVSKVLRGEGPTYGIRLEVQQRILRVADEHGYCPNHMARALKSGKTGLIAIVGASAGFPIRGIRQHDAATALTSKGYHVQLFDFAWGRRPELLMRDIDGLRPEGILVSEIEGPELISYVMRMQARGVPVVGLDFMPGVDVDQVYIDREAAGYLPAKRLIDLGHRRIAYAISEGPGWHISHRKAGFQRALREAGIEPSDDNVIPLGRTRNYYEAGAEVVRSGTIARGGYTAVAALSDQVAAGILCASLEAGIRVPGDLSLIGAEGLPEAEFTAVPLTTAAFPMREVADRAVAFLVERIAGHNGPARSVKVSPHLEVRRSCARLAYAAPSMKEPAAT